MLGHIKRTDVLIMFLFAIAPVTSDHEVSGLEPEQIIALQFCRLGAGCRTHQTIIKVLDDGTVFGKFWRTPFPFSASWAVMCLPPSLEDWEVSEVALSPDLLEMLGLPLCILNVHSSGRNPHLTLPLFNLFLCVLLGTPQLCWIQLEKPDSLLYFHSPFLRHLIHSQAGGAGGRDSFCRWLTYRCV